MDLHGLWGASKKNGWKFLGGAGLVLGFSLILFLLRSPVLVVGDVPFNTIYGEERIRLRRVQASLRLFRRVKPVLIADNAGPDMVSFAVERAASSPRCVLFPFRYADGAERYAEQFPQTPVFLLGGRKPDFQAHKTILITTAGAIDFYRAGLCAAIVAQSGSAGATGEEPAAGVPGGDVLLFHRNNLTQEEQSAFREGLREQGFEKEPVLLSLTQDYADTRVVDCGVLDGQAASFLDKNPKIPLILFSWVDPALTATTVKVIFDDSPWALVCELARRMPREAQSLPSEPYILGERLGGGVLGRGRVLGGGLGGGGLGGRGLDRGVLQRLKNVVYN